MSHVYWRNLSWSVGWQSQSTKPLRTHGMSGLNRQRAQSTPFGLLRLGLPKGPHTHIPSIIPQMQTPRPFAEGVPTSPNHLPPSWGRGLPLFDAPKPEMFSEGSYWLQEAVGCLLLLGPQVGHKAHHTRTSWYAYAAICGSFNDIHDGPILLASTVTRVLALSIFCQHKVFASYNTKRCSSVSRSSFCLWLIQVDQVSCHVLLTFGGTLRGECRGSYCAGPWTR